MERETAQLDKILAIGLSKQLRDWLRCLCAWQQQVRCSHYASSSSQWSKALAKSLQGFHRNFPNQDLNVLMYAPDKNWFWRLRTQSKQIEYKYYQFAVSNWPQPVEVKKLKNICYHQGDWEMSSSEQTSNHERFGFGNAESLEDAPFRARIRKLWRLAQRSHRMMNVASCLVALYIQTASPWAKCQNCFMRSPKLSQTNGMMWRGRFQALKAERSERSRLERQLGLSTHNPNRMSADDQ